MNRASSCAPGGARRARAEGRPAPDVRVGPLRVEAVRAGRLVRVAAPARRNHHDDQGGEPGRGSAPAHTSRSQASSISVAVLGDQALARFGEGLQVRCRWRRRVRRCPPRARPGSGGGCRSRSCAHWKSAAVGDAVHDDAEELPAPAEEAPVLRLLPGDALGQLAGAQRDHEHPLHLDGVLARLRCGRRASRWRPSRTSAKAHIEGLLANTPPSTSANGVVRSSGAAMRAASK